MDKSKINISKSGTLSAIFILCLALVMSYKLEYRVSSVQGPQIKIKDLPMIIGDWKGNELPGLGIRTTEILQLNSYVRRLYTNSSGEKVMLYVGYWSKQSGDYQAAKHSPALCLPANGWQVSQERVIRNSITRNSLIGEMNRERWLFNYWFFSGAKTYWNQWYALLHISLQTFFHGRSDGGIIEISTPVKDEAKANEVLKDFLSAFQPEINMLLITSEEHTIEHN
jgi:EpsI family protein